MNEHLRQRIEELFSECTQVILATCGPAGPQVSQVPSAVRERWLILKVDRTSDHLFNLDVQPKLALLTPGWELRGSGLLLSTNPDVYLHSWQAAIQVFPTRVHILDPDSRRRVETIDFSTPS